MDNFFENLKIAGKQKVQDFDGHFDPIIPFDQFTTPNIPATLLPPAVGDFVQNIADVLLVPVAMPVMASLGIISAALAKKFVVSPKPDWQEPVNIYTLTAMLPASNKSQTLKYLKAPIDEWEELEKNRIGPAREKVLAEIKILEQEIKKQYSIVGGKKSKQADIDTAKETLLKLEPELQAKKVSAPVIPQVYTTDATPEAIAELVKEQGGRLAIISDEGGITEVLAGLYNKGHANIDIILKGIDGGSARIKRANRDLRLNPYLTLTLLVQPQVLINMADKKTFQGNGALERYLFALPVGNVGYREFDQNVKIDDWARQRYNTLIINLLSIPVPDTPYILTLDYPSQDIFWAFRQEIERELRADGNLYLCQGWGGKLAGNTLRLAGLLHVAEHNNVSHLTIQKETMDHAITMARLLMGHTVAAFNLMGLDNEAKDAQELFEWVKTRAEDRLTKTEIINAMHNRRMGKKERLGKAIEALINRNILSQVHLDTSTRKPTDVYFINPAIF